MRSIAVGVLVCSRLARRGGRGPATDAQCAGADASGRHLRLTLTDALAQAEPASEQVGIAQAGVRRAKGAVMETRACLLPQINLGPQYTYVFENPYQSLFPPDPTGSNPFTATNQWRIGGSASMSLLNLSQWARLGASKAATRVSELQLSQQQALTILTVASAYYDASLTAQLVTITEYTLAQAERTLKDVTLGRDVGTQSEFEQLRSRVARDNQIPVVTRARANRDIASTRLKQLLDIPLTTEVVLETPLDDQENPGTLPQGVDTLLQGVDTAAAARAVVRTAEETVQQNETTEYGGRTAVDPDAVDHHELQPRRLQRLTSFRPARVRQRLELHRRAQLADLHLRAGSSGSKRQTAANLDAARLQAKLTGEQAALDNVTVQARLREAQDNARRDRQRRGAGDPGLRDRRAALPRGTLDPDGTAGCAAPVGAGACQPGAGRPRPPGGAAAPDAPAVPAARHRGPGIAATTSTVTSTGTAAQTLSGAVTRRRDADSPCHQLHHGKCHGSVEMSGRNVA